MMMTTTLNVVAAAVVHYLEAASPEPNRLGQNGQGGLDGLTCGPNYGDDSTLVSNE